MGMVLSEIYFQEGIPKFEEIKTKFNEYTGLDLTMLGYINLIELTNNERKIINFLNRDIDKVEKIIDESKNIIELRESLNKTNNLGPFRLYALDFSPLEFEGKTIRLLYGLGRHYFPKSLIRTLIDLGGIPKSFNEKDDQEDYLEKRKNELKRLKKWGEYKWYNRPRK